jgi:hypothetical protein
MNAFATELLSELDLEGRVTRRFLERIPFTNAEFQPASASEPILGARYPYSPHPCLVAFCT